MAFSLFQFWNTDTPPAEVATLMESWAADADFTYRRVTTETAAAYIAEHIGERALTAFRQCAIPAMQADFFRYCALWAEGGVYVDADTENGGGLADLIAPTDRGLLMNRQDRIANDFLFVRAPHDPLFRHCVDQAIENVENRVSNNVWKVTGPGIMTALHKSDPAQFDSFTLRPASEIRDTVIFRHKLDYKDSAEDWRKNLDTGAPSIFCDPG